MILSFYVISDFALFFLFILKPGHTEVKEFRMRSYKNRILGYLLSDY